MKNTDIEKNTEDFGTHPLLIETLAFVIVTGNKRKMYLWWVVSHD